MVARFVIAAAVIAVAGVAAQSGNAVHPVITTMKDFVPSGTPRHERFNSMAVPVTERGKPATRTVEGEYRFQRFTYKGQAPALPSELEIVRNYEAEALRIGGTIHAKGGNRLSFSVPRPGGGVTWCKVGAGTRTYTLEIVDEQPLEPSLAFDAEAMRNALAAEGRVAVYGILFDVDRATLQPGSGKVADEIARLLNLDSSLRIEVQGHTDATGAAAHNRDLSQRRAQAVIAALALYGVEPNRLVAKGYGPDRPVGDNATDDGRRQNRRVELVKLP